MPDPVVIADYDPRWPAVFAELRDHLAAALGLLAVRIEHVGSTAVPGLAAKPIVDLDVVIATRSDLPAVVARLRPLGYAHEGDLGVPGREAFTAPPGGPPQHLYVCPADSPRPGPPPGPARPPPRRPAGSRRLRRPETLPGRPLRP